MQYSDRAKEEKKGKGSRKEENSEKGGRVKVSNRYRDPAGHNLELDVILFTEKNRHSSS